MIKQFFENLLNVNISSIESKYPYFCACVLDTYFSTLEAGTSVSSLNGNVVVLPYFDRSNKFVETHTPLYIYNALISDSFPLHVEIETIVSGIEFNLSEDKNNEWVKLLLKWAESGRPFKTKAIIGEALLLGSQLQIDRHRFEENLSVKLNQIQKTFRQNQNEIYEWMFNKKETISSPLK